MPADVRIDRTWEKDGILGECVSWSVGYGPRTEAWVLKPADAKHPLPGIVALHDHGGFKVVGKEKIADGPDDPPAYIQTWWQKLYGGRAFANALAHEGFVVLVPDVFLWGSRRFDQKQMPAWTEEAYAGLKNKDQAIPDDIGLYNFAASQHEHQVEKYCHILGTTLAGVVSHEDRIAVNYLRGRSDVSWVGSIGLSGGGGRSALLQATHDHIRAAVVVGMMASYEHLLDRHVMTHTWMFFPAGWSRYGDWPDLAACRAPSPLLVQYDSDDELFSREAMNAADQRLTRHYQNSNGAYRGEFYPGPHKFDLDMQRSAFAWLKEQI
jgi:dienelactone hydrolase